MTFSKTEQELFDTWNSVKEDDIKRNQMTSDLIGLIEEDVREGELTDEQKETLNAYNTLFNYEVGYGYRCSYTLDCSELEQEEECSKEDLIDYLKGDDTPEEPSAHDSVASGEVDIWVDYTGDIRPHIDIYNFEFKEIYTNFTPKNVVAPIKGNTSTRELSLEIRERKEGLTADDLVAFGNTLMGMVNSFNGDYEINSVGTTYTEE